MAEYIKRDAAIERLEKLFQLQAATARTIIDAIPAADVVEVVRCRDCKYYQNSAGNCDDDACPISYRCDRLNKHMFESDYCSFGERKE